MKFFDWNEYAFKSKSDIKSLKPLVFLAAPRKLSEQYVVNLFKSYATSSNVLIGIAKEDFIKGFEDQEQFRTLKLTDIENFVDKVRKSKAKDRLHFIEYFQDDLIHILEKIPFKKVLFVNGSWSRVFHTRSEFYTLVKNKIDYELVSAFSSEEEAKEYFKSIKSKVQKDTKKIKIGHIFKDDNEAFELVDNIAKFSFDNSFQTGAVLTKNKKLLAYSWNRVVPYETYALLNGYQREIHLSPPNDTNHYDTNHAEVEMLIKANKENIDLAGTTLYINLLPCPSCARMICNTEISEIKYKIDHSEGYAFDLLKKAGKEVERV
ncbi:MAG: deaminase [Candidatus Dojkabacteria bacterium]|nr:deaminase [Candidatus Dojkabacteria bacterium]MDQ7020972.1 deaminase [Candidatus Dojkabacteria bacterium]